MDGRYLLRDDGTMAVLGDDGWPIEIEDIAAMLEDERDCPGEIGNPSPAVVDVQPVSVRDTELSGPRELA